MKFRKTINLIQVFLKSSPQTKAKLYNQVMIHNQIPLSSVPSDDAYINKFLSEIDCDYLAINNVKQQSYNQFNASLSNKNIKEITEIIKNMSQANVETTKYVEAEQIINLMTAQEAHERKKYLVYLYKLLDKQKQKIAELFIELNSSLIHTVIRKICDGAEYHQKLLKNNQEMSIKSLLNQARQKQKIGDVQVARQKYEMLYQDKNVQDEIRMQALSYLCQKGKEKGDINYLENIMEKAKQEGIDKHEKYIKNFIQKMSDLKKQK